MSLLVGGAGLPTTGTASLKEALERLLGGPCYHMFEVFAHPEHIPHWHAAARAQAVAGLVSVHDRTWTTHLGRLHSWAKAGSPAPEEVERVLADDGIVFAFLQRFSSLIGLWTDDDQCLALAQPISEQAAHRRHQAPCPESRQRRRPGRPADAGQAIRKRPYLVTRA